MLTKREYDIIVGCFIQCSTMHSLPFEWDPVKAHLKASKSYKNKFFCYSTALLYVIGVSNAGLGILKMYKENRRTGSVQGEFFIGVAYFDGFAILACFHLNFIAHKQNIASFFNRAMFLNLNFTTGTVGILLFHYSQLQLSHISSSEFENRIRV